MKRLVAGFLALCLLTGVVMPPLLSALGNDDGEQVEVYADVDDTDDGAALEDADTDAGVASYFFITLDDSGHVTVVAPDDVPYDVLDGEGDLFVRFWTSQPAVNENDFDIYLPDGWAYEMIFDEGDMVTVRLYKEADLPEALDIYIILDEWLHVTVNAPDGLYYEIFENVPEPTDEEDALDIGDIVIVLWQGYTSRDIAEDDLTVTLPEGWAFTVTLDDINGTITVTLSPAADFATENATENATDDATEDATEDTTDEDTEDLPEEAAEEADETEIYLTVDEERNVTVTVPEEIYYEVIDGEMEADIVVVFWTNEADITLGEEMLTIELPADWAYAIEIDEDSQVLGVLLTQKKVAEIETEAEAIHIALDDEGSITVTAPETITYEITNEAGDIFIKLTPAPVMPIGISMDAIDGDTADTAKADKEVNIDAESIWFTLPTGWVYEVAPTAAEDAENQGVTVLLRNEDFAVMARQLLSRSYFTPAEENNPNMWYAQADHVVVLAATPESGADGVYTRLRRAIQGATRNAVTHIIIPVHINTGTISTNESVVVIPPGATVVLIGAHQATDRPITISDTHGTPISRTFRVQGDGNERTALVLRNIELQKSPSRGTSITTNPQATPDTPPAPTVSQTGDSRGGGITVEPAGGGGHLILCANSVVRNSSTDNNGVIDVQREGRFTMMPGSKIHSNIADNGGGGVSVGGVNARFYMYGGEIYNNNARADNTTSATTRGTGGGVLVHTTNTGGGTFRMYDGKIYNNIANSGGGVSVTGQSSLFHMYGGTIEENAARGNSNHAAQARGVGGGVLVQAGGTFEMHDGTIQENNASIGFGMTSLPSVGNANAIVTSSGGGVFVTGTSTTGVSSSFDMYNGTISNNNAIRTVSSAVANATNRSIFRAGNGGGVFVNAGASFTMHDGHIIDNTATATGTVSTNNNHDALNLSNGGGVYVDGANTTFRMGGGTISGNSAIRAVNSVPTTVATRMPIITGNGGGVHVFNNATFTMDGGTITNNTATATGSNPANNDNGIVTLSSGGGVFVSHNARFTMNSGSIEGNRAIGTASATSSFAGNGGGVYAHSTTTSHNTFTMNGGSITNNTATVHGSPVERGGGGVYVGGSAVFTLENGIISGNTANHASQWQGGGGIFVTGTARLTMRSGEINGNTATHSGGGISIGPTAFATINSAVIDNNLAEDSGGGISAKNGSNLTINGGSINNNLAKNNGGGMFVGGEGTRRSVVNISGARITNNFAGDGGGMYISRNQLDGVMVAQSTVFTNNVAFNGVRIDNALAAMYSTRINPGTVSIAWTEAVPAGSDNYVNAAVHAFTNYDINSEGPRFWRVIYDVEYGDGDVTATIGPNAFPVTNRYFVPHDAEVSFAATPAPVFVNWNVGVRNAEFDVSKSEVPFNFTNGGTATPLVRNITANTYARGIFTGGYTITFDPNGGIGEPYKQLTPQGSHTISREAAHEDVNGAPMIFAGWNTAANGSGTHYNVGDNIYINADITLYAQWAYESTTLTISKTLTGTFANLNEPFHFTIYFTDAKGNPLPAGRQFSYTWGTGETSGITPRLGGALTLQDGGSATFSLQHGQAITLDAVLLDHAVRVVQTIHPNYATSFTDSETSGTTPGNDTNLRPMTPNRAFAFISERIVVPPTGLRLGNATATFSLAAIMVFAGLAMAVHKLTLGRRRR